MIDYTKESYERHTFQKSIGIRTLFSTFRERLAANHNFSGESHNFWEFVCVLDGCVGITAGDAVYTLYKNQFFLHPPLEFHRIWSAQGTEPYVVIMSFSADRMPEIHEFIYPVGEEAQDFIMRLAAKAERLFDYTEKGVRAREGVTQTELEIFLKELEIFILGILSGSSLPDNRERSVSVDSYRRIIRTMEQNIGKRLSVGELADACDMSKSSLKKIFSQYCGEGVIKHFNDMKIKAAIPMLQEGKSVAEVSASFGFEEQSYFSTVFKRIIGISPANYVKRYGDTSI